MLTGYTYEGAIHRGIEEFECQLFNDIRVYLGTRRVAVLCWLDEEEINDRIKEFISTSSSKDDYLGSTCYGYLDIKSNKIKAVETSNASPITYWISDDDFTLLCSDTTKCRIGGNN